MLKIYYRGYILVRLKMLRKDYEIVDKLKNLKSSLADEDWKVTYVTPIYGGWDLIIECKFSKLQELDKIVTFCRVDEELSSWIEETMTLCGTKPNFP